MTFDFEEIPFSNVEHYCIQQLENVCLRLVKTCMKSYVNYYIFQENTPKLKQNIPFN